MSLVHITRIAPSKFQNDSGDRWRLEIDGEWYDAYLTPDASAIEPGDHDVEFKVSPKTGKSYAVAVDGRYRTQGAARAPQQRLAQPAYVTPSVAVPRAPAAPAPAEARAGAKDMWIMATSILQAVIAKDDRHDGSLIELAREAALAARAAARVFEGQPMDAVKAAAERPAVPRAPNPVPAPVDPDDPREFGSDFEFDSEIPF